ncbi:hypothetical protein HanIR_Chr05g0237671 [Helianthus annuus]|nr:hypothetical protein HanIR_Chr05g0237671 [Helianthus annuus]
MKSKTRTFRTKRQSCEDSVEKLTWAFGTVMRASARPCISDKQESPGGAPGVQARRARL